MRFRFPCVVEENAIADVEEAPVRRRQGVLPIEFAQLSDAVVPNHKAVLATNLEMKDMSVKPLDYQITERYISVSSPTEPRQEQLSTNLFRCSKNFGDKLDQIRNVDWIYGVFNVKQPTVKAIMNHQLAKFFDQNVLFLHRQRKELVTYFCTIREFGDNRT